MSSLRIATTAITLVVLSACATPYQAMGTSGGYEERKLADDRYLVRFLGNGFTDKEVVRQYWERRAGELCGGRPFKAEASQGTSERMGMVIVGASAYATRNKFPTMEGVVECLP